MVLVSVNPYGHCKPFSIYLLKHVLLQTQKKTFSKFDLAQHKIVYQLEAHKDQKRVKFSRQLLTLIHFKNIEWKKFLIADAFNESPHAKTIIKSHNSFIDVRINNELLI